MIEQYYSILNLKETFTLAELKAAYRKRAKELHPDLNKEEDAHEKFILLNEAYEYLYNQKTGKVFANGKYRVKSYGTYTQWKEAEQANVRKRANAQAEMKFDDFTSTDYYKLVESLDILLDAFSFTISVSLLLSPLIGYFYMGTKGLISGFLLFVFTSFFWVNILIHKKIRVNIKQIYNAFAILIPSVFFKILLASFINFFLFFKIGLSTLIPLYGLFLLYLFLGIFAYFFSLKFIKKNRIVLSVAVAPSIVSLFLLLNYAISTNPTVERYSFQNDYNRAKGGGIANNSINIDNKVYENYIGIRLFYSTPIGDSIVYEFEEGLFGLKVLKNYQIK